MSARIAGNVSRAGRRGLGSRSGDVPGQGSTGRGHVGRRKSLQAIRPGDKLLGTPQSSVLSVGGTVEVLASSPWIASGRQQIVDLARGPARAQSSVAAEAAFSPSYCAAKVRCLGAVRFLSFVGGSEGLSRPMITSSGAIYSASWNEYDLQNKRSVMHCHGSVAASHTCTNTYPSLGLCVVIAAINEVIWRRPIHPSTPPTYSLETAAKDAIVTADTGMCNVWTARYIDPLSDAPHQFAARLDGERLPIA